MLYQLYETQRSLMEPFADFAQAAAKMYGNPQTLLGKNQMSQRISAGYNLVYRLGKDYEKPVFGISSVDVDGVAVAISERVERDLPFCELRRFKRFSDDLATLEKLKSQPVVLVVAPLSGHYATLLRDTVQTMLKDHKVYVTDWKNARLVPLSDGEFHLDDYVHYVEDFIHHLQAKYGNCHVISVCQPTVPVLAAVSLMASRGELTPLSMTMMGGPIDARKSPTAVNNLATTKPYEWFETKVIYRVPEGFPGKGRRVYPGFLQHTGFVAMNPDRHANSHYDYFKDLLKGDDASTEAHRKFYDEYNAVLDMDADYYLETIRTVFQDFSLVLGTWDVKSKAGVPERVRPQDIQNTALLTVEGELDDISGSGQTEAAHGLCTGIRVHQHLEAQGAGHYGIFSGRRWRDLVYPAVKSFILEHNTQAKSSEATVTKEQKAIKPIAKKAAKAKPTPTPTPTPKPTPKPLTAAKPAATLKKSTATAKPSPAPVVARAALKAAPAATPKHSAATAPATSTTSTTQTTPAAPAMPQAPSVQPAAQPTANVPAAAVTAAAAPAVTVKPATAANQPPARPALGTAPPAAAATAHKRSRR